MMAFGIDATTLLKAILDQDLNQLSTFKIPWSDIGLPIQLRPYDTQLSTLMVAAHHGFTECVRKLLEMVDPFRLNTIYKKALQYAASADKFECVGLLSRHALFAGNSVIDRQGLNQFILGLENLDFSLVQDFVDSLNDNKNGPGWIDGTEGSNVMSLLILHNCPPNFLQSMIDHGAMVNQCDRHGFTPLMTAAIAGRVECAHILLRNGADLNLQDKKDALAFSNHGYYDDYYKTNVKGDIVDGERKTALMYAVIGDKVKCVILLLEYGADVNVIDEGGFTVLMHATYIGNSECVKEILNSSQCVNVNHTDLSKRSALIHAAYAGDTTSVELLLQAKANQYQKDSCARTAYMAGVISKNTSCAMKLLKFKSDIDMKDSDGTTSLMHAAESGNVELLELLLQKMKSALHLKKDQTKHILNAALFCAVKTGGVRCVDVLLQHGCDVNSRDLKEKTPLMHACRSGNANLFYLLTKHGAKMNAVVKRTKYSVLMYALDLELECVEFLLKNKVKVEQCNADGETVLMLACLSGRFDCVELFIKYGANINAVDHRKHSVLMKAAEGGCLKCFNFIFDAGADADVVDGYNHTIFGILLRLSRNRLLKALIDRRAIFEGGKLKKVHVKAFKYMPVSSCHLSIIVTLMENGIFKWIWYRQHNRLPFAAVVSGISPGLFFDKDSRIIHLSDLSEIKIASFKDGHALSPLLSAFLRFEPQVVRFLLANLYFTTDDYITIVSNKKFQCAIRGRTYIPNMISLLDQVSFQPWSLQTLSLICISTSISHSHQDLNRSNPRADRVDSLPVPDKFKMRLKFQGPLSKLCPSSWNCIGKPPGSDEMQQDLLSLTKPVWPYPQDLVACQNKKCGCNGVGLSIGTG